MNKKLFGFNTKTLVGTALGAALFTVLMMYVKIPTGLPSTEIQTCYGIGGFFAAMFGPIAGCLLAFIGHFISDSLSYGAWWSWIIASGVCCFIIGLVYPKLQVEDGIFTKKDLVTYNVIQVIANAIAWIIIAPVLDIVIYSEPVELVFTQGLVAGVYNIISAGVIGSVLLFLYSKTRAKKGSLTKE